MSEDYDDADDGMEREDNAETLLVLSRAWLRRIKRAKEFKQAEFGDLAEEGVKYYTGDESVWSERPKRGSPSMDDDEIPTPSFKFTLAKVAELVQIFGPSLYHQNPVRTVTVRELPELRRELFVDPRLERQVGKMQQQMQQYQQQLQQQMGPPQPGAPPPPPHTQHKLTQHKMQVQQLQQQVQQSQDAFEAAQDERRLHDTRAEARAELIRALLNYTPNETDLKRSSRRAVDECLIKGMGTLWTEGRKGPNNRLLISSFFDTVDSLQVDPDAECWEEVKWIARRCVHLVDDVASDYGKSLSMLRQKGTFESAESQAERREDSLNRKPADADKDMLVYWKIWSKVGVGRKLHGLSDAVKDALEELGQNIYLVVAPGIDEPLNISFKQIKQLLKLRKKKPKDEVEAQEIQAKADEIFAKTQWPIPFHLDDQWPVVPLWFHDIPNTLWPMAHIRTGLPQLKFMNWNLSWMAEHARQTARLFFGTTKELDEETLAELRSGKAFTHVKLTGSNNETMNSIAQFMTPPQGGCTELMAVNARIQEEFEKATGLTELSYAMAGGMRSAAESNIKRDVMNIRPDDMASQTEDWMTRLARNEALAWIWLADGNDVSPAVGETGAKIWDELVASQDPLDVAAELDFRIEAGSARKPNRETEAANANLLMQSMGATLTKMIDRGQVGPWNALMTHIAEVNQIANIEDFLLPPPPPPQPPQVDPNVAAKTQAEVQKIQMEMQARQQETQLKSQEAQLKVASQQQGLAISAAKAQQDMAQDNAKFMQEQQQFAERQRMQSMMNPMPGAM